MADPPYKIYCDSYFVTKASLDRRLAANTKGAARGVADVLAPLVARIDELERKLAGMRPKP